MSLREIGRFIVVALFIAETQASDVYGVNAVGYVNTTIPRGFSLISNPLIPVDARLSALIPILDSRKIVITYPTPHGLENAEIDPDLKVWKPEQNEPEFWPGDGFFVFNPGGDLTITFVGAVASGSITNHIPAGLSIQSSMVPQAADLDVLGFPAEPGDLVHVFNSQKQRFESFFFVDPEIRWWPSPPFLNVGEAFYVLKVRETNWVRSFSVTQPALSRQLPGVQFVR